MRSRLSSPRLPGGVGAVNPQGCSSCPLASGAAHPLSGLALLLQRRGKSSSSSGGNQGRGRQRFPATQHTFPEHLRPELSFGHELKSAAHEISRLEFITNTDGLLNYSHTESETLPSLSPPPSMSSWLAGVRYESTLERLFEEGLLAEATLLRQAAQETKLNVVVPAVQSLGTAVATWNCGEAAISDDGALSSSLQQLRSSAGQGAAGGGFSGGGGGVSSPSSGGRGAMDGGEGRRGVHQATAHDPAFMIVGGLLNSLELSAAFDCWPRTPLPAPPAQPSSNGRAPPAQPSAGSDVAQEIGIVGAEGADGTLSGGAETGGPPPAAAAAAPSPAALQARAALDAWLGDKLARAMVDIAKARHASLQVAAAAARQGAPAAEEGAASDEDEASSAALDSRGGDRGAGGERGGPRLYTENGKPLPPACVPTVLARLVGGRYVPPAARVPTLSALLASPDPGDTDTLSVLRPWVEAISASAAVLAAAASQQIEALAATAAAEAPLESVLEARRLALASNGEVEPRANLHQKRSMSLSRVTDRFLASAVTAARGLHPEQPFISTAAIQDNFFFGKASFPPSGLEGLASTVAASAATPSTGERQRLRSPARAKGGVSEEDGGGGGGGEAEGDGQPSLSSAAEAFPRIFVKSKYTGPVPSSGGEVADVLLCSAAPSRVYCDSPTGLALGAQVAAKGSVDGAHIAAAATLVRDAVLLAPLPPAVYRALLRAAVRAEDPEVAAWVLGHIDAALSAVQVLRRAAGAGGAQLAASPPSAEGGLLPGVDNAAAAAAAAPASPEGTLHLRLPDVAGLVRAVAEAVEGAALAATAAPPTSADPSSLPPGPPLSPRVASLLLQLVTAFSPYGVDGSWAEFGEGDALPLAARLFARFGQGDRVLEVLELRVRMHAGAALPGGSGAPAPLGALASSLGDLDSAITRGAVPVTLAIDRPIPSTLALHAGAADGTAGSAPPSAALSQVDAVALLPPPLFSSSGVVSRALALSTAVGAHPVSLQAASAALGLSAFLGGAVGQALHALLQQGWERMPETALGLAPLLRPAGRAPSPLAQEVPLAPAPASLAALIAGRGAPGERGSTALSDEGGGAAAVSANTLLGVPASSATARLLSLWHSGGPAASPPWRLREGDLLLADAAIHSLAAAGRAQDALLLWRGIVCCDAADAAPDPSGPGLLLPRRYQAHVVSREVELRTFAAWLGGAPRLQGAPPTGALPPAHAPYGLLAPSQLAGLGPGVGDDRSGGGPGGRGSPGGDGGTPQFNPGLSAVRWDAACLPDVVRAAVSLGDHATGVLEDVKAIFVRHPELLRSAPLAATFCSLLGRDGAAPLDGVATDPSPSPSSSAAAAAAAAGGDRAHLYTMLRFLERIPLEQRSGALGAALVDAVVRVCLLPPRPAAPPNVTVASPPAADSKSLAPLLPQSFNVRPSGSSGGAATDAANLLLNGALRLRFPLPPDTAPRLVLGVFGVDARSLCGSAAEGMQAARAAALAAAGDDSLPVEEAVARLQCALYLLRGFGAKGYAAPPLEGGERGGDASPLPLSLARQELAWMTHLLVGHAATTAMRCAALCATARADAAAYASADSRKTQNMRRQRSAALHANSLLNEALEAYGAAARDPAITTALLALGTPQMLAMACVLPVVRAAAPAAAGAGQSSTVGEQAPAAALVGAEPIKSAGVAVGGGSATTPSPPDTSPRLPAGAFPTAPVLPDSSVIAAGFGVAARSVVPAAVLRAPRDYLLRPHAAPAAAVGAGGTPAVLAEFFVSLDGRADAEALLQRALALCTDAAQAAITRWQDIAHAREVMALTPPVGADPAPPGHPLGSAECGMLAHACLFINRRWPAAPRTGTVAAALPGKQLPGTAGEEVPGDPLPSPGPEALEALEDPFVSLVNQLKRCWNAHDTARQEAQWASSHALHAQRKWAERHAKGSTKGGAAAALLAAGSKEAPAAAGWRSLPPAPELGVESLAAVASYLHSRGMLWRLVRTLRMARDLVPEGELLPLGGDVQTAAQAGGGAGPAADWEPLLVGLLRSQTTPTAASASASAVSAAAVARPSSELPSASPSDQVPATGAVGMEAVAAAAALERALCEPGRAPTAPLSRTLRAVSSHMFRWRLPAGLHWEHPLDISVNPAAARQAQATAPPPPSAASSASTPAAAAAPPPPAAASSASPARAGDGVRLLGRNANDWMATYRQKAVGPQGGHALQRQMGALLKELQGGSAGEPPVTGAVAPSPPRPVDPASRSQLATIVSSTVEAVWARAPDTSLPMLPHLLQFAVDAGCALGAPALEAAMRFVIAERDVRLMLPLVLLAMRAGAQGGLGAPPLAAQRGMAPFLWLSVLAAATVGESASLVAALTSAAEEATNSRAGALGGNGAAAAAQLASLRREALVTAAAAARARGEVPLADALGALLQQQQQSSQQQQRVAAGDGGAQPGARGKATAGAASAAIRAPRTTARTAGEGSDARKAAAGTAAAAASAPGVSATAGGAKKGNGGGVAGAAVSTHGPRAAAATGQGASVGATTQTPNTRKRGAKAARAPSTEASVETSTKPLQAAAGGVFQPTLLPEHLMAAVAGERPAAANTRAVPMAKHRAPKVRVPQPEPTAPQLQ